MTKLSLSYILCWFMIISIIPLLSTGQPILQRTYIAANGLSAVNVIQTNDSSYLLTGDIRYQTAPGSITTDAILMKVDTLGAILWCKTYEGNKADVLRKTVKLSDGNYISIGGTESYGPYGVMGLNDTAFYNIVILITDSSGSVIKSVYAGDTLNDYGQDILQDMNGFIVAISGYNDYNIGFNNLNEVLLMKMDTDLNIVWTKSYSSNNGYDIVASGIAESLDGGYYITGNLYEYDSVSNWSDSYLLRTDSAGNELWSVRMGDQDTDLSGVHILRSSDNGVYVGFSTHGLGATGWSDFVITQIDSSGSILWARKYGGLYDDDITSMNFTPDSSSIILSSWSRLLQINLLGIIEWTSLTNFNAISVTHGYTGGFLFSCIYQTPANQFLGIAQIDSSGNSCYPSNYIYPSMSILLQPIPANISSNQITIGSNPFSVTIGSANINDSLLCLTYTGTDEVSNISGNINIYPNPFDSQIYIESEFVLTGAIQVMVTNLYGQVVKSYGYLPQSISFDGYANGIYMVSINNGKLVMRYKIVKRS